MALSPTSPPARSPLPALAASPRTPAAPAPPRTPARATPKLPSASSRSASASGQFQQRSQRARLSCTVCSGEDCSSEDCTAAPVKSAPVKTVQSSAAPVKYCLQVGHVVQSSSWCAAAALVRQLTCARPPLLPGRQHAQPVESSGSSGWPSQSANWQPSTRAPSLVPSQARARMSAPKRRCPSTEPLTESAGRTPSTL